ncbi:phytanoyl-CoA dioxygenase PhyH [Gemmobacter caeni]|uniref:Phytanoyl-CoA dioxygenase PhyH n=1 Tax=Gemmobacter caeni TaxID=589035 RepID=A0A2T6AP47_9RHOB|nr:phytanoyl-CoA dioxygenase family protein [Gemmobacter caeni]PTX45577.1 phytanoyl-CoA dioxygenase PhyH [Gemmobacter caeni]TWI93725.1 phytanoyl-CoA dioxygenase PhyH [Gemmobacter caeni]
MVGARGWHRIGPDPAIANWAAAARPVAEAVLRDSAEPWRCGGTWFVGVDALPNGPDGAMGGAGFPWQAVGLAPEPLHPAQLSVMRPGYPQPSEAETPAAFAFRRDRDAAHLDGLLADAAKRRRIAEPHHWILGMALNETDPEAAPLVVWEGSHRILQAALAAALAPHPPARWAEVDITDAYVAARRQCFETCRRVAVPSRPGQAVLMHRHLLHGVAPWAAGAKAPPEGRIIAYFRPLMPDVASWLMPE